MRIKHKLCFLLLLFASTAIQAQDNLEFFPQKKSKEVNPDTHLLIYFAEQPTLGNSGKIRVFDASSHKIIDSLDLSKAAGPTELNQYKVPYTPQPYDYVEGLFTNANTKAGKASGMALPTLDNYQLNIIGGFTDAFHFYPVIIHNNVATITLHNNLLQYNKKYYVTIDPEVFSTKNTPFTGISKASNWWFSTKKSAPKRKQTTLIVSADGSGDFNTLQGALDYIPMNNQKAYTIYIKKGFYEEIVYFRKKSNITIVGENKENTIIYYDNNEIFNPHPINITTNELPGTFPSRRATFMADNCNNIYIANISFINPSVHQAEAVLITGEQNMLYKLNISGGGDALQVNGSAYIKECKIDGEADIILGRGAAFFENCELSSPGPLMWIRNTADNHGNVFVNCRLIGTGDTPSVIARAPINRGKAYLTSEAVLINCKLSGISDEGWGPIGGDPTNMRYWEYDSRNLIDNEAIDTSKRHPASKQLSKEKDAEKIANYKKPSYILGGWNPPLILLIKSIENFTLSTQINRNKDFHFNDNF